MSANIKKVYMTTRDGRLHVIEPNPHRKSVFEFERDVSELELWKAQPNENEIPTHLNSNELPIVFNLSVYVLTDDDNATGDRLGGIGSSGR